MSWLPKRDKLDLVQASAIDFAVENWARPLRGIRASGWAARAFPLS